MREKFVTLLMEDVMKIIGIMVIMVMMSGCAGTHSIKNYREITLGSLSTVAGKKNPYPGKNIGILVGTAIGGALSGSLWK